MGVTIKGKPGNARFKVDSDSDDEEVQVTEERYLEALTASGLGRAEDYSVAAEELTLLLTSGTYSTAFSKGAQSAVLKDIATAVAACSSRLQDRRALAALMEAVERHLPQAKRNALLRDYKRSSVTLRRRERRGKGAASQPAAEGSDTDTESEPATFSQLPPEVVATVFRYLDPLSLARGACVCRGWRDLAADECGVWEALLSRTFSAAQQRRLLARAGLALGRGEAGGSGGGWDCGGTSRGSVERRDRISSGGSTAGASDHGGSSRRLSLSKMAFALGTQRYPRAVLVWKTNRILLRNGRLAWLSSAERLGLLSDQGSLVGPATASGRLVAPSEIWQQRGDSTCQGGVGARPAQTRGVQVRGASAHLPGYQHVSPQDVVQYWQRGGRLLPGLDGGSSSDSDSETDDDVLNLRMKFWRAAD